MGDVSQFMKLVKQRFSIWYNKTHQRFGTLWAERFKSVLVEVAAQALSATAAYIDLNGVRAGLVMDPKDYRFCGYAEAVAGSESARSGIQFVVDTAGWSAAQAYYRELIFGIGGYPRENAAGFSSADVTRIIGEGGRLSPASLLRCRIRYFSDGLVLGGRVFVETQRHMRAANCRPTSFVLPMCIDWGELAIFRRPRGSAIG
jgi:hypothetical protein